MEMISTTREGAAPGVATVRNTARPVWLVGVVASVVAAVATIVFALIAKAIDVPLEVDGEEIPIVGFGFLTVIWSLVGTALAMALARWAKRPAAVFVVVTVVLTLVSFVPVITADSDTATQVVLALAHVLAAVIVIPALALRLAVRK
jgi:peptidoglycan/LPS O-acetylase OafA/YrhL